MLNQQEQSLIEERLGRKPSDVEWAMFDAMWSEHCSYKSSKHWFSLFSKTTNERVRLGIGEGAGLVDVGDGQLVGLALESHNHPSAIDPFNGAATGVGGIIRDIISQGCQPIALLDSLRFGRLDNNHTQYLLDNVVRGISSYGNCVGLPNLGGDVAFDHSYQTNCLVNVMCVGLVEEGKVVRSKASNVGDRLILFGSRTGRDGIGGVTFASEDLSDESSAKRPAVQIGDPATEKILIDAIQELINEKLINGMQDLGGGGFTCASSEIVFTGGLGVEVEIDHIPLREQGMDPWEIMISESQERMLVVASPECVSQVCRVLERHELAYGVVGTVIAEDRYVARLRDIIVADVPVSFMVEGFPVYHHPQESLPSLPAVDLSLQPDHLMVEYAKELFRSPTLGDKRFIYEQYDRHVQTRTMIEAGDNCGVLTIGHGKAIGVVLDTNDYQVLLHPRFGTAASVLRCVGKLWASGFEPIALVDCLNFGNPEKPDSYWQFVESVRGLADVVNTMNLPVVGGNVSLYNESEGKQGRQRINPTPTIGLLGLAQDHSYVGTGQLKRPNTQLLLLGNALFQLDGSELVRWVSRKPIGRLEKPDVDQCIRTGEAVKRMVNEQLTLSARCVSRGGLVGCLAKMVFGSELGLRVELNPITVRKQLSEVELLFGETTGTYVVEVTTELVSEVKKQLDNAKVPYWDLGKTTNQPEFFFNNNSFSIKDLEEEWRLAIPKQMVI